MYIAAITHGRPRPRNTFTELEPVTFPTAESAHSEVLAAVILAKVSGREVPMATKVIAVTGLGTPRTQPSSSATAPTTPVSIPMKTRATMNAGQPPPFLGGGTVAKINFQNIERKWIKACP